MLIMIYFLLNLHYFLKRWGLSRYVLDLRFAYIVNQIVNQKIIRNQKKAAFFGKQNSKSKKPSFKNH